MAPVLKSGQMSIEEAVEKIIATERLTEAVQKAVKEAASKEFANLMDKLNTQESKIMDLETTQQTQKHEIKKLKGVVDGYQSRIQRLEKETNDLEQYSKRNCLLFFGVPETKGEDTTEEVCKIAREKLHIDLNPSTIDRSHRLQRRNQGNDADNSPGATPASGRMQTRSGRRDDQSGQSNSASTAPRPLLVKFVSYQNRQRVIKNRKLLKGTRMSIQEHLTRKNQELLAKTRANTEVKDAWTSDGKIVALIRATGGKFITRGIRGNDDLPKG